MKTTTLSVLTGIGMILTTLEPTIFIGLTTVSFFWTLEEIIIIKKSS